MAGYNCRYKVGRVIIGDRIAERLEALNLSQTELGRRVGLSQPAIYALINRNKTGSKYLHAVARELGTTAAYLEGETDDPSSNASPPRPKPTAQIATMQVVLPDSRALERMFLGILMASDGLSKEALARELALMLPKGLGLLRGPLVFEGWDDDDASSAEPEDDHDDRPARRQA